MLWESDFPDAIIAASVALIAVDVLGATSATTTAIVAIPLCLVTARPGVVDQADVNARPGLP